MAPAGKQNNCAFNSETKSLAVWVELGRNLRPFLKEGEN